MRKRREVRAEEAATLTHGDRINIAGLNKGACKGAVGRGGRAEEARVLSPRRLTGPDGCAEGQEPLKPVPACQSTATEGPGGAGRLNQQVS